MSEAVFAPALFFGGGVLMIVALGVTMTVLRGIETVRARFATRSALAVPDGDPAQPRDDQSRRQLTGLHATPG